MNRDKHLKLRVKRAQNRLSSEYQRFERNSVYPEEKGGARYVPWYAVRDAFTALRSLRKAERRLKLHRDAQKPTVEELTHKVVREARKKFGW